MASVRHHDCAWNCTSVKNLIPTDDSLASLAKVCIEMLYEIVLEIIHRRQTKTVGKMVAILACSPGILRTLISSDVIILRREKLKNLVKHILKELEGLRAWTEDVSLDSPRGNHFLRFIRST